MLANEQLEVSISFSKLSDSEANDQALLGSRIEKIDAELDTLAANIVSRVLFLETSGDTGIARDSQADQTQMDDSEPDLSEQAPKA